MKDAVLTVRLPLATRRRIEGLARQEGRSLSQQVERLLAAGLAQAGAAAGARPLSGSLASPTPGLAAFRAVRRQASASLRRLRTRRP